MTKSAPSLLPLLLARTPVILSAQTRRIGLVEDPDVLDPSPACSFVGRVASIELCCTLFNIDEKLATMPQPATRNPQLATGYRLSAIGYRLSVTGNGWSAGSKTLTLKLRPGVAFHDGEKFDAAAVKFNIERCKTLPGSSRHGEPALVPGVDVVDLATVRPNLLASIWRRIG